MDPELLFWFRCNAVVAFYKVWLAAIPPPQTGSMQSPSKQQRTQNDVQQHRSVPFGAPKEAAPDLSFSQQSAGQSASRPAGETMTGSSVSICLYTCSGLHTSIHADACYCYKRGMPFSDFMGLHEFSERKSRKASGSFKLNYNLHIYFLVRNLSFRVAREGHLLTYTQEIIRGFKFLSQGLGRDKYLLQWITAGTQLSTAGSGGLVKIPQNLGSIGTGNNDPGSFNPFDLPSPTYSSPVPNYVDNSFAEFSPIAGAPVQPKIFNPMR